MDLVDVDVLCISEQFITEKCAHETFAKNSVKKQIKPISKSVKKLQIF